MNLRTFLLLPLLVSATAVFAQKKTKSTKEVLTQGTRFIRFNFTGLVDVVEPNLSAGYEYRFKENLSVSADAGFIFYSRYFENAGKAKGVLFRPAIRWYPDRRDNFYCEAELHYKRVVHNLEDWLGRDCVNGVPSYEEYTRFDYAREVVGLHIKGGYQERITRNGKLWFEVYAGIGARYRREKVINKPNSCYNNALSILDWGATPTEDGNGQNNWGAALPGGFRLLFRIN